MSDVLFESRRRFSALSIWENQKKYYAEKGIEAWANDVPSYVTCNPFIARQYAWTTICFIYEWARKNPDMAQQPFYLIELGAGTGQFSFYFLKNLLEYQKLLQCESIKIRYVMTDVTAGLFSFWKNHPALKLFVDSGVLDFAIYDINNEIDLSLQIASKKITPADMSNPPVIIANYIFDSLATDLFQVKNGELKAVLASLKTKSDNLADQTFHDINKVQFEYETALISEKYYHNEFDFLLSQYQQELVDSYFQFPVTLLNAIDKIRLLSNNRFLLISSDKGYSSLEELDHVDQPELAFHGNCFSIMVNFHALSQYVKLMQGDFKIQSFRDYIISGVFSVGFKMNELPMLNASSFELTDRFSPVDYFELYKNIERNDEESTLEEMLSFLNLSNWDTHLFAHLCDRLLELSEKADPDTLTFLLKNLSKVADNFYYFPNCVDVYFNVALVYQGIHYFEEAIGYYQKSMAVFGEGEVVLFNLAMCCYSLGQKTDALDFLNRALLLNPGLPQIEEMIKIIKGDK